MNYTAQYTYNINDVLTIPASTTSREFGILGYLAPHLVWFTSSF